VPLLRKLKAQKTNVKISAPIATATL